MDKISFVIPNSSNNNTNNTNNTINIIENNTKTDNFENKKKRNN